MSITDRFDFHVIDFVHSEVVAEMDASEVGQFILLLSEAWIIGKDTSLPDSRKYLARTARVESVSEVVLACFPVVETEWGMRRRNKALFLEWQAAKVRIEKSLDGNRRGGRSTSEAKSQAARENGKLGGRPGKTQQPNETQEPNETQVNPTQPNPVPSRPVPSRPVSTRPDPTRPDSASSKNELAGEGGRAFFHEAAAIGMGVPNKSEMEQLQAQVATEPCGLEFLKHAVITEFQNRPQGLGGLKNPWRMFLSEVDTHFANAKAKLLSSGDWRLEHVPGERAHQEASIAHQNADIAKQWAAKSSTFMEDPNDFFATN